MEHVRRHLVAALAAVVLVLAAPSTALAVDYVVNTTADNGTGGCTALECTLREAITLAGPNDTVTVPGGTYQLQTAGELSLEGDKVNGAGARTTIVRGNGTGRVMSVSNGPNSEAAAISGLSITNGGGAGQASSGSGGGIYTTGTLSVANSHIVGNSGSAGGGGIFVNSGSNLILVGSTVSGNTVSNSGVARGGGIEGENENQILAVINSTISGNTVTSLTPGNAQGGGIAGGGGTNLILSNATVAGNTAGSGGGIHIVSDASLQNSIIADNSGGACAGTGVPDIPATAHHNLITDGTCTLTGPGNLQGIGAQLGALGNYGGPTDTRALAPSSPAINAGSECQASDQRGITRPQGGACDIGAYEYRAPVLTVATTVVNDHGFNDVASDFTLRVDGNAAPGSAGAAYTLAPGTHVVSADARRGYTFAYGGACAADGSVTLGEGGTAVCTVTANDPSPTPGQEVNALPARGTVRVKLAGKKWRQLKEGEQLPKGTSVDTLKGRVTLLAAGGQRMTFYDGIFKITSQTKGSRPRTTLTLTEKLSCKASSARKATTAAKKKTKRRLWGDGRGKFRVKGKHSAATVVGTKWLVQDKCRSTLTRVVRGKVKVRDFVKKKTITLRKGKRYTARAKR